MAIKLTPCVSIYKVLKTGIYIVQPHTIGPVAATEFGETTVIRAQEFEERIADAVMSNLDKFGKEQYDKSRAIIRSDKQQKEFLRDHLGVSVSRWESGQLAVYALHREGGGMIGSHEDTFILFNDEIAQKLTATIAEAFRRAT
jgi:hypothetical protein